MLWLNAALAFAITMLILSMVTNVFVETIHRFAGMREKGLKLMLGHLFDRIIAPHFPELGSGDPGSMSAEQIESFRHKRQEFMELMTVNRAPAGTALKGDVNRAGNEVETDESWLRWPWRGRRIDYLNVEGFMARLGSSEFGDVVRANSGEALTEVLKDLAQKFDAFGAEASEFFQRRARLLSVVVSIIVAWFMYVHPYEMFRTFVNDSAKAAAVIAMKEETTAEYEKFLDGEVKKADDKARELAAKAAIAPPADKVAVDAELDAAVAKWREATTYAANAKLKLSNAGVPIGWDDKRRAAAGFRELRILDFIKIPMPIFSSDNGLRTAMWLILGGLLVGLGGPFWYDMIKSLSAITALLGSAKGKADQQTKPSSSGGKDTAQPQTPVENFNAAAKGRDAATGSGAGEAPDDEPVG